MKHKLKDAVLSLKDSPNINQKTLQTFLSRLNSNPKHLKAEGVPDHFCVGCIALNKEKKKIFLGHHIKSDHWMGVGGHMELGESPMQTALREFEEELNFKAPNMTLFDLTHFDDVNRTDCTDHFDFFYYVLLDSCPMFEYDKKEFHQAQWLTFDKALKKKLIPKYRTSLLKLLAA